MATKRSRAVRSSIQGEIGVVNRGFSLETQPAALFGNKRAAFFCAAKPFSKHERPKRWASIEKEEPRLPVVFTVESLERESVGSKKKKKKKNVDGGFGEFLEACSRCKKKLDENKDVFMYGYLGAFCSSHCRDRQMAIDGFNEEVSKELAARFAAVGCCNKR